MSDNKFSLGVSEDELSNARRGRAARTILDAAANIADQSRFDIGDVLVAMNKRTKKFIHLANSDVSQKYVVVHKDAANIIYTKKILSSGKLGAGVELICTYDRNNYEFQLDPDMVDGILLDQEDKYDPFAQAREVKKFKDKIKRHNEKIRVNLGEYNNLRYKQNFMKDLEVGDVFYSMWGWGDLHPKKYTVQAVREVPLDHTVNRYSGEKLDKDFISAGLTSKYVLDVVFTTGSSNISQPATLGMRDFRHGYFFLTEPKTYKMGET